MADLFQTAPARTGDYSAKDIEVLEGLEPVRRRPAMSAAEDIARGIGVGRHGEGADDQLSIGQFELRFAHFVSCSLM